MSHLKIKHLPANRQVERNKPQHIWKGSIYEHWLPSFSRYTALISNHVPYYSVLKMAVIFFLETLANLCQTTPQNTVIKTYFSDVITSCVYVPLILLVTQQMTHISSYFHQTCQLVCLKLAYFSEGRWTFLSQNLKDIFQDIKTSRDVISTTVPEKAAPFIFTFYSEDESNSYLRHVGIYTPTYTAS
jgi:hypothetical protein